MEETFFVGLRMMEGISTEAFRTAFGRTVSEVYGKLPEKLESEGLVTLRDGRIALTDYGVDVSNYVMAQFLMD
jgi:oxygen-independent coproporphyrinogen-3 oxidase